MSAALVEWLARTGVQAGLLAFAVLALELVARGRLAPTLRLGLWLVVALRFALPGPVPVDLPAIPWSGATARVTEDGQDAPTAYITDVPPVPPSRSDVPERVGQRAEPLQESSDDVALEGGQVAPREPAPAVPAVSRAVDPARIAGARSAPVPFERSMAAPQGDPAPPPVETRGWHVALIAVWLGGLFALLVRAVSAERDLRRALRMHAVRPDERIAGAVELAARAVGLRRAPETVVFDALDSPAVHGAWRPRLLLPSSAAELAPDELRAVLVHECFHLRRRDLWWTPVLALLRAVWWFHPLAHVAVRHALAALEEMRDTDAVRALEPQGSPNSPARLAYARVLVRLAEARTLAPRRSAPGALPMAREGRGLRRRVEMILTTPMSSPRTRVFLRASGATLLATFAWAGLVQADVDRPGAPTAREVSDDGRGATRDSIVVERQGPPPAARVAIEERLGKRLPEVSFSQVDPMDAFRFVSEAFDVNVVVLPEALQDNGVDSVSVGVADVTGAELLDALVRACDCELEWTIVGEVVAVGDSGSLPRDLDLRFYKVRPILDRAFERGVHDIDLDFLLSLAMDYAECGEEAWERPGTSADVWEGMLAVRQSDEAHQELHAFLDRLLNLQLQPVEGDEPWRAELERKLSSRASVSLVDMDLSTALETLATTYGAPIRFTDGHPDDWGNYVQLELRDATLRTALEWCLVEASHRITVDAGEIVLREGAPLEVHLHPIGALIHHESCEDPDELLDYVEQFMRNSIDPESWDIDPYASITVFGDLLVVRQSRENQARIRALLAQVERALDD